MKGLVTSEYLFASICSVHGHVITRSPHVLLQSTCPLSSLLPILHAVRLMRAWTTPDQRAWLTARIPQWHRRKQTGCKGFMENLVADFLKAFPDSDLDRLKLRSVSVVLFLFTTENNC